MAGQKTISPEQLDQFRAQLRELHNGLLGQVNRTVESIQGEMNPAGNLSTAPIHMADAASGQIDADINVVENEQSLLEEVQGALHRMEEGHYGECINCGSQISIKRLQVIPYAPYCLDCANKMDDTQGEPARPQGGGTMRLTGFEAIEFAEKEGLTLNKKSDSIDDAAEGLTIAEAEAIASENADLIWLEIASDEYGVRKNMEPDR